MMVKKCVGAGDRSRSRSWTRYIANCQLTGHRMRLFRSERARWPLPSHTIAFNRPSIEHDRIASYTYRLALAAYLSAQRSARKMIEAPVASSSNDLPVK